MKKLLFTLLIGVLLAACKDNPASPGESQEGYRVGTLWVQPDKARADWEGKGQGKILTYRMAGDTTNVVQPIGNGLTMAYDSLVGTIVARFTDSTLTNEDFIPLETDTYAYTVDSDTIDYNNAFRTRAIGTKRTPEYIQAKFRLNVRCDGEGVPPSYMVITVADSTFKKIYKLQVDGMYEAGEDIGC